MSTYQGVAHKPKRVPKITRTVDVEIKLYRNGAFDEIGHDRNRENASFGARMASPWLGTGSYFGKMTPLGLGRFLDTSWASRRL